MSPPDRMRAVVLTGHGDIKKLEYRDDYPVPRPAPDEVLIEVAACGVNNTDVNTRVGWYEGGSWGGHIEFPRVQGADPVGRIVAVGDRVSPDRVGERVLVDPWLRGPSLDDARYLGSELDGGFADFVAVPTGNAHEIDTELTDVELASFACSYSTAEHMVERAGVGSGQWVLVTGASGGVGGALIQLSQRRGGRVIAVTSAAKIELIRDAGAEVVLDRDMADLAETVIEATGGVDVFADVVGGDGFTPLFGTIRRGGQYVVAGAVAGAEVRLDLRTLYLRDITMHGATVVPAEVFGNLVGYIADGELKPMVDRAFALHALRHAQHYFLERSHVGSVVIDMGMK